MKVARTLGIMLQAFHCDQLLGIMPASVIRSNSNQSVDQNVLSRCDGSLSRTVWLSNDQTRVVLPLKSQHWSLIGKNDIKIWPL